MTDEWSPADSGNEDLDQLVGQYLATQLLKSLWIAPVSGPVSLSGIIGRLLDRPLTVVERSMFDSIGFAARGACSDTESGFFARLRTWSAANNAREQASRPIPMPPPAAADAFEHGGVDR